jgi:hypothetical protein
MVVNNKDLTLLSTLSCPLYLFLALLLDSLLLNPLSFTYENSVSAQIQRGGAMLPEKQFSIN